MSLWLVHIKPFSIFLDLFCLFSAYTLTISFNSLFFFFWSTIPFIGSNLQVKLESFNIWILFRVIFSTCPHYSFFLCFSWFFWLFSWFVLYKKVIVYHCSLLLYMSILCFVKDLIILPFIPICSIFLCPCFRNMSTIVCNSGASLWTHGLCLILVYWFHILCLIYWRFAVVVLQLWMVLHLCAGFCLSGADTPTGLYHEADGEPMEDLR